MIHNGATVALGARVNEAQRPLSTGSQDQHRSGAKGSPVGAWQARDRSLTTHEEYDFSLVQFGPERDQSRTFGPQDFAQFT